MQRRMITRRVSIRRVDSSALEGARSIEEGELIKMGLCRHQECLSMEVLE